MRRARGVLAPWSAAAAAVLLLLPVAASAQGFPLMTPRALGMGGAFTAIADDASAVFWNPAGLPQLPGDQLILFGGRLETSSGRFEQKLDRTLRRQPDDPDTYESALHTVELTQNLESLNSDSVYATASQQLGLVLASRKMGLTLVEYRTQGARPVIDLSHIAPVDPSDPTSVAHNASELSLSGFDRRELSLTSSLFRPRARLMGGATLRYVQVTSYQDRPGLWSLSTGDLTRLLDGVRDRETRRDQGWALDVGLIWLVGRMRVGLVARNVNAPSFAYPDGTRLRLDRQTRLGLAWYTRGRLGFAIDYDLKENAAMAEGIPERRGALGLEKWFSGGSWALRLGAHTNLAVSGAPLVLTAGASYRGRYMGGDIALAGDQEGDGLSLLAAFTLTLTEPQAGTQPPRRGGGSARGHRN